MRQGVLEVIHLFSVFENHIVVVAFAAIKLLHNNKVAHLDIKPDNVLFTTSEEDEVSTDLRFSLYQSRALTFAFLWINC
jgi:serine/threonine protein kinase